MYINHDLIKNEISVKYYNLSLWQIKYHAPKNDILHQKNSIFIKFLCIIIFFSLIHTIV